MWFEIYLDAEDKWRWRLCRILSSGLIDIIATSHQAYSDKSVCEIDIMNVKLTNATTPIRYI
ncbi:hypothetical protein [Glaesserella parasuis]|uniref:DUF1508 domain-containing protein n=1 Tax=Glaesserella parasuis TaxID=738 RepID=A0A859IH08_GLAPU|nr:hypothetical protein [Glaesserella parasuis]QKY73281.1 hypothetical protein FLK62_08555 [Glaesserella parasuis]